ncbi:hypothetical protein B0A54_07871 [Friedmanniomyces endolithicus]|uniref:SET domain-containing protein n=1 Tax=Friedmanniomyces endolithicus TaxID=329885 RepID=A0A4V5NAA9_9PEZI|nr:hypothetical protein B0A54_07871 [Friedmanniomyces endolithicus]
MDYAALLQKQKQLTLDAQGRKGNKATNKHGRAFLEMLFANKSGGVDRLAVYNTHPTTPIEQILPKHALFALREPFYKATVDGGYTIRVDHPSDLIRLQAGDERVPAAFCPRLVELDKEAGGLKAEGNAAYGRKEYCTAAELYSEALQACSADGKDSLRYDLYRNRANANLLLQRHEAALVDADAAVIPLELGAEVLDEATAKLNGKAYYRAGRAAYALRDFARAAEYFRKVERCSASGDGDAEREGKRTACRLEEQKTGRYDFAAMSKAVSATRNNRLDHADFTVRVKNGDAGSRGRGLFAVKALKMGDLVLCEKAFGLVFASENAKEVYTMVNLNTNRASMGAHATLLFDLVQKLSHNPEQARVYFDLHDGGYTPKIPPQLVDGVTVIDTFRVEAISEYNRFGCPNVRSSDGASVKPRAALGKNDDEDGEGGDSQLENSVGVWVVASHINHACDGNAGRAFIGDMMVIRAVRDIGAGEEILMPYCNPKNDGPAMRTHMEKTWGFECDCRICEADGGTTKAQLDLEATYDKTAFANNRPRLALTTLGHWLCQAYNFASSQRKVIECAIRLLRDLGYGISVANKKVTIDYSGGCPDIKAFDAAMYTAHAQYSLGERKQGLYYEEFAEGLWVVLYAEKQGFRERYGSS